MNPQQGIPPTNQPAQPQPMQPPMTAVQPAAAPSVTPSPVPMPTSTAAPATTQPAPSISPQPGADIVATPAAMQQPSGQPAPPVPTPSIQAQTASAPSSAAPPNIGSAATSTQSPFGAPATGLNADNAQQPGVGPVPGASGAQATPAVSAMKHRSMPGFIALLLLTCGIYFIIWYFSTANELRKSGQDVPSIWLTLIPLAAFWWIWKYVQAANVVTNNAMGKPLMYILLLCVSVVGIPLLQLEYNKISQ